MNDAYKEEVEGELKLNLVYLYVNKNDRRLENIIDKHHKS